MRPLTSFLIINRRLKRRSRWQRSASHRAGLAGLGVMAALALALALAGVGAGAAYANLTRGLPGTQALPALLDPPGGLLLQPTRLTDRTGAHVIAALENPGAPRAALSLDTASPDHLPPALLQYTLAALDPDCRGRACFALASNTPAVRAMASGLASDLLYWDEPPGTRRDLRVRLSAGEMLTTYGPERVAAWYLNSAYYGHLAYGAASAARLYFGVPASQLSPAQSAVLAAVMQAPALNPLDAPEAARAAQIDFVGSLIARGALSKDEARFALESVTFAPAPAPAAEVVSARAFTELTVSQLAGRIPRERLERGGLVIRTTLDFDLQTQLACAARDELLHLSGFAPADDPTCAAARLIPTLPPGAADNLPGGLAASAVVTDPQTGEVLALLGDATLAEDGSLVESPYLTSREGGTLLTPFIYLAGITRGMAPASLVWDIPSSLTAEQAAAHPGTFRGPLRLRSALANDDLAPAAQLLEQVSPSAVWAQAGSFGLPDFSGETGLPFSGGKLTPLQAARAYGVFATGGVAAGAVSPDGALEPVTVLALRDAPGIPGVEGRAWALPAASTRPILSSPVAYLMNHMLSDVTARWPSLGYANPLEIGRPAGAKLGQSAGDSSAWAAGYTPQRAAVIWIGAAKETGEASALVDPRIPAGLWHAVLQYAARDLPPAGWSAPPGVSTVEVCDPSGLLPTAACANVVSEVFIDGTQPTGPDTLYRTFQVNRETGRLATVFTDPALVDERTYLVVPAEARQWAGEAGLSVPPALYDDIQAPPAIPGSQVTAPGMFASVSGSVAIRGEAAGEGFAGYRIQAGQGLNPQAWFQLTEGSLVGQPVKAGGTLALWETRDQPDGLYALRLQVVRENQRVETAVVQVTVDNTPPEVMLIYPAQGARLAAGTVTLQAEADDGLGLDRVEWWVDGKPAAEQRQAPFSLPWKLPRGTHTVQVKAYDLAGNLTESPLVTVTVE